MEVATSCLAPNRPQNMIYTDILTWATLPFFINKYQQVLGGTHFQLPVWHPTGLKYKYVQTYLHG